MTGGGRTTTDPSHFRMAAELSGIVAPEGSLHGTTATGRTAVPVMVRSTTPRPASTPAEGCAMAKNMVQNMAQNMAPTAATTVTNIVRPTTRQLQTMVHG